MKVLGTKASANIKSFLFSATGGTEATSGGFKYHTFTGNGTLSVNGTISADILVVAGGGPTGGWDGRNEGQGGGGAGGLLYFTSQNLSTQNYSITVGAGGTAVDANASNGSNSQFQGLTLALGGGCGGGFRGPEDTTGRSGGSGGGGSYGWGPGTTGPYGEAGKFGGAGTSGQGNAGGNGLGQRGGGGGGASSSGGTATSSNPGTGGSGSTYFGSTYAVGGDGGFWNDAGTRNAVSGSANTGNGGRGAAGDKTNSGSNGGSGIVIVRYAV